MKQVLFSALSGSPDTPEWHAWRAQGIGGSDASPVAAAAGLIKKASWMPSLDRLWQQKTGLREGPALNPAMKRGRDGEDAARAAFEEMTGVPVSPVFGEMESHTEIRASLDGISFDGDLLVEIKCPSRKVHDLAVGGEIVDYYLPQLAHQSMVVWGHPGGWKDQRVNFYSFIPETGEGALVDLPVKRLAALAEAMLPKELEFWQSVLAKINPAGDVFADAAQRWKDLMDEMDTLKVDVDTARDALVGLMGDRAREEGNGVLVARAAVKGRVDYAKLVAQMGIAEDVIERFRSAPSTVIQVRRLK